MAWQLIKVLESKKARASLAFLSITFVVAAIFPCFSSTSKSQSFISLFWVTFLLLHVPRLHKYWMQHKKSEPSFYLITGALILFFLSAAILTFS
jgi:hypothetical protein